MNAAVDPNSAIGQAARAWALAVFDDDFPRAKSERLRAWLAEDPRHLAAYEHAERTLDLLTQLPLAAEGVRSTPIARARRPARAWLIAASASLAAACAVAVAFVATPPPPYESAAGQIRAVALTDGSQLVLAPGSRIRAQSRLNPRALTLEQGEVFFQVAHRGGRPFTVRAGAAVVGVVGTRFNVHLGQDTAVDVRVEQGVVRVAHDGDDKGLAPVTLTAGMQAVLAGNTLRVTHLGSIDAVATWRSGRLTYDDVPLREVVADLRRYRTRPLSVGSPAVGALRVTAAFDARQANDFLAILPRTLPVAIVENAQGDVVIADARSAARP